MEVEVEMKEDQEEAKINKGKLHQADVSRVSPYSYSQHLCLFPFISLYIHFTVTFPHLSKVV